MCMFVPLNKFGPSDGILMLVMNYVVRADMFFFIFLSEVLRNYEAGAHKYII
jgi:hypothetical protein